MTAARNPWCHTTAPAATALLLALAGCGGEPAVEIPTDGFAQGKG